MRCPSPFIRVPKNNISSLGREKWPDVRSHQIIPQTGFQYKRARQLPIKRSVDPHRHSGVEPWAFVRCTWTSSKCERATIRAHCVFWKDPRKISRNLSRWIIILIVILFTIRQLQVIPQVFYSTSHFTMLMLLIHKYTPCVDYSPYQSNVFSNVIMSLTTSCVSDPTLYVRI